MERELRILDSDDAPYGEPERQLSKFREMPVMPDAFICANDFLALSIMATLKRYGVPIPDEVMVAGFDGTPQSSIVEPALGFPATTLAVWPRICCWPGLKIPTARSSAPMSKPPRCGGILRQGNKSGFWKRTHKKAAWSGSTRPFFCQVAERVITREAICRVCRRNDCPSGDRAEYAARRAGVLCRAVFPAERNKKIEICGCVWYNVPV